MIIKRIPIFALLLLFCACGAGFDTGIRRGLTASKITYEGAMEAVDKAERAGKVSSETAKVILGYENRHRTLHNLTLQMLEQYVSMRELGQNEDQLKTLQGQIEGYQTALVLLVVEFVVFLKEMGVM